MSPEQTIFVMIMLMVGGFLVRLLPKNVKEMAEAIGGLAAFLGIVLVVIGYFTDTGILTKIGIFLVAPLLAAFLGTALLENTENAWNAGRSAEQAPPHQKRRMQNQDTGSNSVNEAKKKAQKTSADSQANS